MALAEVRNSDQRHGSRQLRLQDVDEVLDAFLAIVDGVQERSAHANGCGAQTHALEDVGAATHAAVDKDFELREDCGAVELAFEEGHDRGGRSGCGDISIYGRVEIDVRSAVSYVSRLRPP
jgi:hypothetical protein